MKRNKMFPILLIIILVIGSAVGVLWKFKISKPSFTLETYPRVDGSTATIPLSEAVAREMLGLTKEESTNFIKQNTTHYAYENLINNKADIIFVTEPSSQELEMA
jgi:phosphate transport system substrate-binding protein